MYQKIALGAFVGVSPFVGVVPYPRLVHDFAVASCFGLVEDVGHGLLISADAEIEIGGEERKRNCFGKHAYAPWIDV